MNIEQMRMVLALAESGNMTTTARKLQVTQPALTYQLKTIESELGFSIFSRDRKGTVLTPEGSFFCKTLKSILADYDDAVRLSRAIAQGENEGALRVGCDRSSRDMVSAFLRVMQDRTGNPLFSLVPCGMRKPAQLLGEGVIDFWSTSHSAFVENYCKGMQFIALSETQNMIYVPLQHKLANQKEVSISDLAGEEVWMWPEGNISSASDAVRAAIQDQNIAVDIQDFTDETSPLLAMLSGNALAIYDTGFLPPPSHIATGIPLVQEARDEVGLVYLKGDEDRLAGALATIQENLKNYSNADAAGDALRAGRIAAVLDEIVDTICCGGMRDIIPLVDYALEMGAPADHILGRAVFAGMDAASQLYQEGSSYASEMLAAITTCKLAADELMPLIERDSTVHPLGSAVIGTMEDDQHELGKNLVRIALEGRGIEVVDLGSQVTPQGFVDYVRENPNCNLVLVSLYRDEARESFIETISALEAAKLRERVFVMVGGPAANAEFCKEAGADAFTQDAIEAARTAYNFLRY